MTTFAMVSILRPFFLGSKTIPRRAEYDMQIYQDQLQELKHDAGNGLITSEEERSAQIEVARRILKADGDLNSPQNSPITVINPRLALFVGFLIPIVTLGIYFFIGSPNLVSPFSSQIDSNLAKENTKPKMNSLILELKKRLETIKVDFCFQKCQGYFLEKNCSPFDCATQNRNRLRTHEKLFICTPFFPESGQPPRDRGNQFVDALT